MALEQKLEAIKSQLRKADLFVRTSGKTEPAPSSSGGEWQQPETKDETSSSLFPHLSNSGLIAGVHDNSELAMTLISGSDRRSAVRDSSPELQKAEISSIPDHVTIVPPPVTSRPPVPSRNMTGSKANPDDFPTESSPKSALARAFNIDGIIDVQIHVTRIRTISVEAVVAVDDSTAPLVDQLVTVTDLAYDKGRTLPYRYVITTTSIAVDDDADEQCQMAKLTSAYARIWSTASLANISSVALSSLLGKASPPKVVASAIFASLVKLSADTTLKTVHLVDTTFDVLRCIIKRFEEGTTENGVAKITEIPSVEAGDAWPTGQHAMASGTRPKKQEAGAGEYTSDHVADYYTFHDAGTGDWPANVYSNAPADGAADATGGRCPVNLLTSMLDDRPAATDSNQFYEDIPPAPVDGTPEDVYSSVEDEQLASVGGADVYESIEETIKSNALPVSRGGASRLERTSAELPAVFLVRDAVKVVVRVEDITRMKVDVVASAVNRLLQPVGRVALAIARTAGASLADDLRNILAEGGPVQDTDVVETLAGSLPAKHVLHAFVPEYPTASQAKERRQWCIGMQSTIENILHYANEIGAASMALPLLGLDTGTMPAAVVTRILSNAVVREVGRMKRAGKPCLKEVYVVSESPDELRLVVGHCLSDHGYRLQSLANPEIQKLVGSARLAEEVSHAGRPEGGGRPASVAASFEPRTFKVGQLTAVVVHVGNITEMHVDAIVSADTCRLDHRLGVARTICDAAGLAMVGYLREIRDNQLMIAVSDVFQTPAGRLPCRLVLHAVSPSWPSTDNPADVVHYLMQLKRTFDNVFELARQNDVTSIAIPPLTADSPKPPAVHMAEKMFRAALDNERRQQSVGGNLREIHYVDVDPEVLSFLVHHFEASPREERITNIGVLKADCETAVRVDRVLGRLPASSQSPAAHVGGGRRFTTQHAYVVPTLDSVRRRRLELPVGYALRDDKLGINVRVLIYHANVAALRTDAIVNPTDGHLKNQRGVSWLIASAAGVQWKRDCQRKIGSKMPVCGVISTGSGSLPCSVVIHVVPPKGCTAANNQQTRRDYQIAEFRCLENVFLKAGEVGFVKTIALPPIRSEKAPAPVDCLANAITMVLLCSVSVRSLNEIHIVDTEDDFLQCVAQTLNTASSLSEGGMQVMPLGPDVDKYIRMAMTPSGIQPDDGDTYSEIPAIVARPQTANAKLSTAFGKVSEKLAKLKKSKKRSGANLNRSLSAAQRPDADHVGESPSLPPR